MTKHERNDLFTKNPPQYTKIIIMPKNVFLHGEITNNEPNIRLKYVVNQVI